MIVDFDPSQMNSRLKARYVLYEEKDPGTYNHLSIAETAKNEKYLESFFYEPSDLYLRNQTKIKIKTVKIFDNKGKLFMQDILF